MKNLAELQEAFKKRCDDSGLEFECGMDGTFFAQVAIVAEAPGPVEVAQKLPLVGGSGSLLWRFLAKHVGITRRECYITNVLKRAVVMSESKRRSVDHHELELWTNLLLWELGHLPHVRYILVLGNYALEALTDKTGITNWRGSVLDISLANHNGGGSRHVQVVCCNNPAAVLREPRLEIVFGYDIGRLKRVMQGEHHVRQISTELYPTVQRVDQWIDEAIRSRDIVATDIETISGETACIGFARTTTEAICIAFRDKEKNIYSLKDELHIRKKIAFFFNSATRFTAMNGMFDITWLWFKDKLRLPQLWFDIMLGHHCLYPTLPHSLGFLTSQYTDNPYYKDEKHQWRDGQEIDTFWDYNGKDCCNTLEVTFKMMKELDQQGMRKFFYEHVMRLQPHLALMTVGGILIDTTLKERLREDLQHQIGTLLDRFNEQCKDALGEEEFYNPNSPKQMSELYFSKLKLVGRGVSTDAENRQRMFAHPRTGEKARAILQTVNAYAKEQKFYSTYIKSEIDDDHRMRCMYNQTGVQEAPGRLSSSQTLWGSGSNLQNQPTRAYQMFIADPGYVFCYFDLSQAEARYVAWDAQIGTWMAQFEKARLEGGYDSHRALAAELFELPYDEVPSFDHYDSGKGHPAPEGKVDGDVTIRYIAKRCRHGLSYRMGPERLATSAGLPMRVAENAYKVYHRQTPELRRWWSTLETELAKQNNCLYNAYGRRYILLEKKSPEALESMVAFKPQSTIGDKVSRVIYLSHEDRLWPSHSRIVLNIHDALMALCREDQAKRALSIMKKHAEEPIVVRGEKLIIPADLKMSYPDEQGVHRWSQLKGVTL